MTDTTNRDVSGPDVPTSERGKGENMPLSKQTPSAVFGIVGLTYFLVLIVALAGIGLAWWLVG